MSWTVTIRPEAKADLREAHDWPGAKHIPAAGRELVTIMVVSDGQCLRLFVGRE